MAKVEHTSDARVLVGIDISKHRHEVLIAVPGKTHRRRLTQHAHDLGFGETALLHRNLLVHLAEKILRLHPLNHGEDYPLITSNLPFDEWTETLGSERLTGALLDRITHHVNILEMNGESYRLAQSRARKPG